jgi:hypothetical protein
MIQPTKYARKPFVVTAVEVTEENMKEVANWCKGRIETEGELPNMKQFIKVNVRGLSSERQSKAYVGDRVLCSNPGNFKVYTARAFQNCFEEIQVVKSVQEGVVTEVVIPTVVPIESANVTDVADPNQGELDENFRDAGTGQFVTEEFAQEHPDTTVKES